jgi:hypothetical protein
LRAADKILDDETGVALLVADVRDLLAIGRPASVPPVEVAEGQRERRGAVGRGQPELAPLPAVIAGEQVNLNLRA